jgi:protein-export membrane protein SecD
MPTASVSRTAMAAVVAAIGVAAFVAAVLFRDSIVDSLPAWLRPQDGPLLVFQVEPDGADLQQAVEAAAGVIDRRFDALGARARVKPEGGGRIAVALGPSIDAEEAIRLATRRGRLEIRRVDPTMDAGQAVVGEPPQGSELLYDAGRQPYLVEKQVAMTGHEIADAQPSYERRLQQPVVIFRFDGEGTRKFGQLTEANVGGALAFVLDGEVLTAPVILEPLLGGTVQISGNLTVEQAVQLAVLLRAGELPGRLTLVERREPGPQYSPVPRSRARSRIGATRALRLASLRPG